MIFHSNTPQSEITIHILVLHVPLWYNSDPCCSCKTNRWDCIPESITLAALKELAKKQHLNDIEINSSTWNYMQPRTKDIWNELLHGKAINFIHFFSHLLLIADALAELWKHSWYIYYNGTCSSTNMAFQYMVHILAIVA